MRPVGNHPSALAMAIATVSASMLGICAAPALADPPQGSPSGEATFMTRNILLGADLGPAFRATSLAQFAAVVGDLLKQVEATNMSVRSKGLAQEIRERKPDVIGLQEVALWRTGPVNVNAAIEQKPTASTVYQDFLKILMHRLNHKHKTYRVVSVANEFDFEAPANTDGNIDTGTLPGTLGAEIDARLTMRDAVLVRRHAGVKVNQRSIATGHYTQANSFTTKILGLVDVTSVRGWQRMNIKVRNSPWFRYGNTHLEAFDDRTQRPSIRSLQAQEFADVVRVNQHGKDLVASGDFNSDFPGLVPGDEQAYLTMRRNGFYDIGTKSPLSCCISGSYDMQHGGSMKDWDHRVDQFWTNTPKRVKTQRTWVTGRHKSFGFWHSDHAGVVARIRLAR
jgi:endonuclease/exonuclease/phosphatase family metal-dependent hydrolase